MIDGKHDDECDVDDEIDDDDEYRGAWWLSGRFGALHLDGRKFEYQSSHHVWILDKSFTHSCL